MEPWRYDEGRMHRLAALAALLCLLLSACQEKTDPVLIPLPPTTVAGWGTTGTEVPDISAAPEQARSLGAKQWMRAGFERAGTRISVEAFAMPSETSAFEAQQKWRRGEGVTTFYKGSIFVICSAREMEMSELLGFAEALEGAWLSGASRR